MGMIQQKARNTKINALFHLKLFANIVIIGKKLLTLHAYLAVIK